MATSLRQKLFLIIIGGIILLALILSSITGVAFTRARNQALVTSASALEQQGKTDLELLLQRNATLVRERFEGAAQAGRSNAEAIVIAAQSKLIDPKYLASLRLIKLPDGGFSDTRPALMMSLYVPPNADQQAVQADIQASAILETILPLQSQAQTFLAATYIGQSGVTRIYPPVALTSVDLQREQELLNSFRNGDPNQVWLAPFKSAKSSGLLLTVVTPIYIQDTFSGIIATDVSLDQTTYDIASYLPTTNSSAFLINDQRSLVAASPKVLTQLTGQASNPGGTSQAAIIPINTTANPDLDQVLTRMANGEEGVERVNIDGVPHFLSFAPIGRTGLRMGLITPTSELTSNAAEVSEKIGSTSFQALLATIASTILFVVVFATVSFYLSRRITRPLTRLVTASHALAEGNYQQQLAVESRDEIGQVATAFNLMSQSVQQAYATLETQKDKLEEMVQERTLELRTTVDQLGESLGQQAKLNDLLSAVSTPVIPVAHDVLLMPLIGSIDQQRAQQALTTLLQHIETEGARSIIIDVTGLPVIDTAVAATLLYCAQAARLLGAETIFVGVRPEVAQTIVTLGTELEHLHFMADLQAAIKLVITGSSLKAGSVSVTNPASLYTLSRS